MVPRHLPKKLLCVALVGTSILAILYYTAGLSNSSEHKFSHENKNELDKKAKNIFDNAGIKGNHYNFFLIHNSDIQIERFQIVGHYLNTSFEINRSFNFKNQSAYRSKPFK